MPPPSWNTLVLAFLAAMPAAMAQLGAERPPAARELAQSNLDRVAVHERLQALELRFESATYRGVEAEHLSAVNPNDPTIYSTLDDAAGEAAQTAMALNALRPPLIMVDDSMIDQSGRPIAPGDEVWWLLDAAKQWQTATVLHLATDDAPAEQAPTGARWLGSAATRAYIAPHAAHGSLNYAVFVVAPNTSAPYWRSMRLRDLGDLARRDASRPEEMMRLYELSFAADPTNPLPVDNMAIYYSEVARDFARAEWHFLRALELQPRWWSTQFNLALLYQAHGRPDQALTHFYAAFFEAPMHLDVIRALAGHLQMVGDLAPACFHWRLLGRLAEGSGAPVGAYGHEIGACMRHLRTRAATLPRPGPGPPQQPDL